ncbi:MAG: GtrA family protein [Thermoplasmataceae archaeon]
MSDFIKNNVTRSLKFFLIGGISFLISEVLLLFFIIYSGYSIIIGAEIFSTTTAVAFGFYLNEIWTAKNLGWHGGGAKGFVWRLIKFEFVNGAGSVESVLLQLFLLYYFRLSPLIGNLLGSIIAAPINYFISMLIVWKIDIFRT